jgi:hypothetical protein
VRRHGPRRGSGTGREMTARASDTGRRGIGPHGGMSTEEHPARGLRVAVARGALGTGACMHDKDG